VAIAKDAVRSGQTRTRAIRARAGNEISDSGRGSDGERGGRIRASSRPRSAAQAERVVFHGQDDIAPSPPHSGYPFITAWERKENRR